MRPSITAFGLVACLVAPLWQAVGADSPPDRVPGELESSSFWIRMFSVNNGAVRYLQQLSQSFQGNACLGEFGRGTYRSSGFQILGGYCAKEHWFLSGGGAGDQPAKVFRTVLGPAVPTPSRNLAIMTYGFAEGQLGTIRVYDVSGRLVRTLVDRESGPLERVITWDLRDNHGVPIGAGVYFVQLRTQSVELTRKIISLGR